MEDSCPNCGLVFGRFEGQWIGAIGINTIVSFGLLGIVMMVAIALSFPNPDTSKLILLSVAVAIVTPIVLFPFSRTFWLALDLIMTPLEPHEVDWTKVDPSLAADAAARRERGATEAAEVHPAGEEAAARSDAAGAGGAATDPAGADRDPDTESPREE